MTAVASGARIEIRGLTKRFGSFLAVDDLSFDVEPGRITGFLGPNGAGKTTTLRMLLGLVHQSSGTATIDGRMYRHLPDPMGTVGAALEATSFHPGRSGRDHLLVLADAARIPHGRVDELLELTGIAAAARKRAGEYSMGMRQRLGLAAALLGDPRVLVLDEPANGLDPEGIRWLRGFLRHLSREGKTILVSSHLLQEVEQTVDEVVIIANGRLVRAGTVDELHGAPAAIVRTSDAAPARRGPARRRRHEHPGRRRHPRRRHDRPAAHRGRRPAGRAPDLRPGGPAGRPRGALLRAHRGHEPQRGRGGPRRAGCRDRPGRSGPVTPAIRSEFRKFFTTRLWWGMAIGDVPGRRPRSPSSTASSSTTRPPSEDRAGASSSGTTRRSRTRCTRRGAASLLLLLTIGILAIGSEFRHKTISATLLATPNRVRAMLAKAVALLAIGVFYGLVSLAGSVSVGAVVLRVIDRPAFPSVGVARTLALSLLVLALWALIGLGIGILIPNQIAALFIGVAVAWIVEPLLGLLLTIWDFTREHVAPLLPTNATNAAFNAISQDPQEVRLEWWGGALTLMAYAVVLAGFGIWRTTRADIS